MNKAIEGARGYLILCVILYHYTSRYTHYGNESFIWDTGFSGGGKLGVSGFLIISGFLYFNSIKKWDDKSPLEVFTSVKKKIIRLYLPFAVAVIFLCFCNIFITFLNNPKWIDFVYNILLLRTILKVPCVDGAHWYFYAMIQLNLLIPCLFLAYKKRSIIFLILGIALCAYLYGTNVLTISKTKILCFMAGAMLSMGNRRASLLYVIFSLLAVCALKTYYVILVFAILPFIFSNKPSINILHILFENKIVGFLGTYSYMWYLVHQQLGYFIIQALMGKINDYLIIILTILVTFVISFFLHRITFKIQSLFNLNK